MSWKGKGGVTFNVETNIPMPDFKTGTKSIYDPAYHPALAQGMYRMGATNAEVAEEFGLSIWTLFKWRMRHHEFGKCCELGKEAADKRVVESLYNRAVGYTYPSSKFFCSEGQVIVEHYKEHVPPDIKAATFWLTNRQPTEWKDKVEHGHSGGGKDGAINVILSAEDKALL